ncbi:MAG: hypothetical protein WCE62_06950 [Polyangiales bacterium]
MGVIPLVGCGDDNGGGGSGGSAGTGGTGGTGGVDTVSVSTVVSGFDATIGLTGPLKDVEICETDTENCVMTDADGAATLQLPLNQETSVTVQKEGYQSELLAALLSAEPTVLANGLGTVERLQGLHELVGSPYPMEGTGDILATWTNLGAFPGATLDLAEPATGEGFYYNEEGNWDADLTATTSYALGPKGGFTEVSPGVVQVAFGGTAEGCVPNNGWPGGVDNSVRLPVRAGYVSELFLSCDAP